MGANVMKGDGGEIHGNKTKHIDFCNTIVHLSACGDPLGMENYEIPDHALLSTKTDWGYADDIRLNGPKEHFLPSRQDEYVQVDLGPGGKTVTAVVLQGYPTKDWITKFVFNHSRDGSEFLSYEENGVAKVFDLIIASHDITY